MTIRGDIRRARARYEAARLQIMIDENRRRLDEIERERNAPCRLCVDAGITAPPTEGTTEK